VSNDVVRCNPRLAATNRSRTNGTALVVASEYFTDATVGHLQHAMNEVAYASVTELPQFAAYIEIRARVNG
jgi:hydrogenase maturation factor